MLSVGGRAIEYCLRGRRAIEHCPILYLEEAILVY
jgi:hypothetical protein